MRRILKRRPFTAAQMKRRQLESVVADHCVINGCIPQDDYAERLFEELESNAVNFSTIWASGEMPVLRYNEAFREWRKNQIEERNRLTTERTTCLLPWQILKHLPTGRQ